MYLWTHFIWHCSNLFPGPPTFNCVTENGVGLGMRLASWCGSGNKGSWCGSGNEVSWWGSGNEASIVPGGALKSAVRFTLLAGAELEAETAPEHHPQGAAGPGAAGGETLHGQVRHDKPCLLK